MAISRSYWWLNDTFPNKDEDGVRNGRNRRKTRFHNHIQNFVALLEVLHSEPRSVLPENFFIRVHLKNSNMKGRRGGRGVSGGKIHYFFSETRLFLKVSSSSSKIFPLDPHHLHNIPVKEKWKRRRDVKKEPTMSPTSGESGWKKKE